MLRRLFTPGAINPQHYSMKERWCKIDKLRLDGASIIIGLREFRFPRLENRNPHKVEEEK
jgi:hypothetical protein